MGCMSNFKKVNCHFIQTSHDLMKFNLLRRHTKVQLVNSDRSPEVATVDRWLH